MTIPSGTKLGRYEIRSKIGEGGMGEVYRARDEKLNRVVAIKVLPAAFSADIDRLRRFEQEAQAASALNHPNILSVYDFGEHDGAPYVVSELLEGETLREQLIGGALDQRKAIAYATQIAHGLSAAHERAITHRDLKPENLFVTKDDRIKILDFGLAKLATRVDQNVPQTDVATRRVITEPGTILGTIGYMSPEQAASKPVDQRSDIFSFGAVVYEMLTGQRAFSRDSKIETLNAILKEDPPEFSTVTSRSVAPALESIVRHCLEKKPERRFQSASDVAFALEHLSNPTRSTQEVIAPPALWSTVTRERLAWLLAVVFLLTTLALTATYLRRAATESKGTSFLIYPPEKEKLNGLDIPFPVAVSPDGRRLALVMAAEGRTRIWLRPLDSLSAEPLENTEGAQNPFWSPDGRFIAFFAGGKLQKISAAGGVPTVICDAPAYGNSGTWNNEDVILFTQNVGAEGIQRVSAAGGVVTQVTQPDPSRQEIYHLWPEFLPDGRHFLFLAGARQRESSVIYVGTLETGTTERLTPVSSRAFYAPSGYLLYLREGTLVAHPFDEKTLRLAGDPVTVAEHVGNFSSTGNAYFSVSTNGDVLAYQVAGNPSRIVWLDRSGVEVGSVGSPNSYKYPRLSPDGQKLAVDVVDQKDGTTDIWIYDLARNMFTRFTFEPGMENGSVWSPDGQRIAYSHDQNGPPNLFQKGLADAEGESLIPSQDGPQYPLDWSPDGQFIIYLDYFAKTRLDLFVLPMSGERKPFPFAHTPFNESQARFSPDGRWIAYASSESGKSEVYVQRFQGGGERVQVSNSGATSPRWRSDGRELFYVTAAPNQTVVAVPVKTGETFEAGNPSTLFKVELVNATDFDVARDGQRFLVNTAAGVPPTPLAVIIGWAANIKR